MGLCFPNYALLEKRPSLFKARVIYRLSNAMLWLIFFQLFHSWSINCWWKLPVNSFLTSNKYKSYFARIYVSKLKSIINASFSWYLQRLKYWQTEFMREIKNDLYYRYFQIFFYRKFWLYFRLKYNYSHKQN